MDLLRGLFKSSEKESDNLSFWEHLDLLRNVMIRIGVVVILSSILGFIFKEKLFEVILAPHNADFITFRLLSDIILFCGFSPIEHFEIELINTALAQQFMIHVKASLCVGILVASPYIIYELFRFISPALYAQERKYSVGVILGGYLMFVFGLMISYFLIFPLTFRFLATYQVSPTVVNMISLESYMNTLLMLSLVMGVLFEIPVVCWLLAKIGILKREFMIHYRRHAIVVILIIAAVITPTSDLLTLLIVSLPIYLLYEISIAIVRRIEISANKKM